LSLKVIRLPTPIIGQDAAVDCAASRRPLGLRLFGAPPLRSRPAAEVERSHEIGICFEPASNALKIAGVPAVGSLREPASGAGLRSVSCALGFDNHPFLCGLVFKRESQEAVGDSVDELARPLRPLGPALPKVFEALDGYSCIELPCQSDYLCCELPASCSGVVSLPSAEPLEFLSGLAWAAGVSVGLKLCPPSLELRLHPRQILPEVELPQHFTLSAQDGQSNGAAVDVHPEHVLAWSWRWRFLSQDGEEIEVVAHDHGTDLPAGPEVGLEPTPSSVLSYRQTYSLRVSTDAQSWVAAPRCLEAEEAAVEADYHVVDPVCGLANSPSVAAGLLYELSRNAEPLAVLVVGQAVQFSTAFNFAIFDQGEALLGHPEERAVCFLELSPLDPRQRERVKHETFLPGHRTRIVPRYLSGLPREVTESIRPQFLPAKAGVSLGCSR